MASDQIHQWIYVIIPVKDKAVFTAFCKGCRNYFSEHIHVALNGRASETKGHLPRYGCEPIDDIVI